MMGFVPDQNPSMRKRNHRKQGIVFAGTWIGSGWPDEVYLIHIVDLPEPAKASGL